ncbi:adenylyl cyclase-associated protein-like protein [Patellaria atrata CBS 101060]|uniref:Adenylyl cyclase-associated protein n=1 Tax=Patellaria atrata CBS 101060 TaxID=1346257 RepID=A0A9P4SHY2_9PEZI|nr:adenylyl cyclase-associated protein-like protein [Patellaria atrata CBS 101060]
MEPIVEEDPLSYHILKAVQIPDGTLTDPVLRLEAATSRLEDIASSQANPDQNAGPQSSTLVATTSASTVPKVDTSPPPQKVAESVPPSVEEFDELINGNLKAWIELSKQVGGVVSDQAGAVKECFDAQRQFILITTKAKKPDMTSPVFLELLKDLQDGILKVEEIRQTNRHSPMKNHLAMAADGIDALRWIIIDAKPAVYVEELFGGAQMYGNNVLKEYKEKERLHVEFVQSFNKLFRALISYIKKHHAQGLIWNAKDGIDALKALQEVKSTPSVNGTSVPPSSGAGAPPPPPPPLPKFDNVPPPPPPPSGSSKAQGSDMGAVFDQLNVGENVTKGLKKVDASQMTHKNPSLRAQTQPPVPQRSSSSSSLGARGKSPAPPRKPESMRTKKPPKKELDGNKWILENYDSPDGPIEIDAQINHSILISKCRGLTLRVHGKANAIAVDNSPKLSLILDSLVSSLDVVKCANFAFQVLGKLPTVMLDQVDGATLYLSKESLATEVFTSKSSAVNVVLPPMDEEGDGDSREFPAPEQIRSFVRDGVLVSEIVEHAG